MKEVAVTRWIIIMAVSVLSAIICMSVGSIVGDTLVIAASWISGRAPIGGPILVNGIVYGASLTGAVIGFGIVNRTLSSIQFTNRDWKWLTVAVLLAVGLLGVLVDSSIRTVSSGLEIGRLRTELDAADLLLDKAEAQLASLGQPVTPHPKPGKRLNVVDIRVK